REKSLINLPRRKAYNSSLSVSKRRKVGNRWRYDVFLNFRGKELRSNFISHLYKSLQWKAALHDVAGVMGFTMPKDDFIGSSESEFVDKRNSQTTSYFILVFSNIWCWSRVHCINELMCFGLDDVFMIRICGMSGIGKTTLAKAAYNESAHLFEGTCFLENFGELLKKRRRDIVFNNTDDPVKHRFQSKKVLVVVEDVIQLTSVGIDLSCFEPGSRIIITTKNSHLLEQLNVETDAIKGSSLKAYVTAIETFSNIRRLQLLERSDVSLIGDYELFSKDLRCLCWLKFPLDSIPANLHLGSLVVMDLQYISLKILWDNKTQVLKKLKYFNLSCKILWKGKDYTHSQDSPQAALSRPFSLHGLSSLMTLRLGSCNLSDQLFPESFPSLGEIDLGDNNFRNLQTDFAGLPKLQIIRVDRCSGLQSMLSLPKELRSLHASNCIMLETTPDLTE
ncbi:unnamed protein product, partial [Brassica oleracea]